jgi:hypothetical protein
MNPRRDPDRLIDTFLNEGAEQLHDQVYDAVRSSIEHRRQRVVIGPWRMPNVNKLVPIGLAAAALIVVLVVGAQLFRPAPSATVGAGPTVAPSTAATTVPTAPPSAAATSRPTPSPSLAPPLSQTFTSGIHRYSVSYPAGWSTKAATKPWTGPLTLSFGEATHDFLYDPALTDHLFLSVASQPLGKTKADAWAAQQMASEEGCAQTAPVTIDGATGLIGSSGCDLAVVTTGGRGYAFRLYTSGDDPGVDVAYNRAWFEELLATVQLQPGG